MKSVRVTNATISYTARGKGAPILLLHGNPDTSEMWTDLVDHLQDRYCCITPDLPGFGRSPASREFDFSLANLASVVQELVLHSGITEPLNLIVHDIGGFFGLPWAIENRQRVGRIVITNALFFTDYRWHFWGKVWRTRVLGELSMALMNRWLFTREVRRGSPCLPQTHIDRSYASYSPATRRTVLDLYRFADPEKFSDWEQRLVALNSKVRSCVIWGDRDPYIEVKFADRFGAEEVHHYADCGHWVPVEAPARMAQVVRSFLA